MVLKLTTEQIEAGAELAAERHFSTHNVCVYGDQHIH